MIIKCLFAPFVRLNDIREGVKEIRSCEDVERSFDAYCKRVIKNRLRDYKRHEAWRKEHEISTNMISENILSNDNTEIFLEVVFFEGEGYVIRNGSLREALEKLPEEKFRIIMEYYFFGKTDQEISEELRLKRTTVRNRRYSALCIIRKTLER